MDYRNSSALKWVVPALAVAGLAVAVSLAGDKPDKSQPQSSTPAAAAPAPAASTASKETNSTPTAAEYEEIEKRLVRPYEFLKKRDSLESMFDLPMPGNLPQPATARPLSRRAIEELDRRRNWAFSDLNELYGEPFLDDFLGTRKSDEATRNNAANSIIDRFYQNSAQKAPGAKNNPDDANDPKGRKIDRLPGDFDPVASAFKGADPFFRKMMTGDSGVEGKSAAEAVAFTRAKAPTADAEALEQQRRLAVFRHELDASYPLPKADNSFAFAGADAAPSAMAGATNSPFAFQHTDIYPSSVIPDPNARAFRSRVYDDPTARALGLPQRPLYPVTTSAPPPTAHSVLSQIDPFNANAPKPKF